MPDSADSPASVRVLAFDFGMKRIGVAFGQTLGATVRPLAPLPAQDGAPRWEQVRALLEEWRPQRLLVGLPCHADGNEHPITRAARRFGNRLHGRFGLPVEWVDERLSSVMAEQRLAQLPSARQRDKIGLDSMAAGLIVETWLAQQSQPQPGAGA